MNDELLMNKCIIFLMLAQVVTDVPSITSEVLFHFVDVNVLACILAHQFD